MKQRNQLITLGVLLIVLAGVAFVVYGPKRSQAVGGGTVASAAAGDATADAGQAAAVVAPLPTKQDLDALGAWLVPKQQKEVAISAKTGFGLAATSRASDGRAAASGASVAPALQGILETAGERQVLIGGESYREGQVVADSDYKVMKIGKDSVTLMSNDGRELVLNLVK